MLKALSTTLHEGRVAFAATRRLPTRPFHTSRPCHSETPPSEAPPTPTSASGSESKPKKPRKKRTSAEPKEPKPVVKSVLQENRLLNQLREIERPGQSLTLEDVEKHRPSWLPHSSSPQYRNKYMGTLRSVKRAFSTTQLREIIKLYGLPEAPPKRSKEFYASLVLGAWGIASPELKAHIERVFPVKPSELTLILMHHKPTFSNWFKNRNLKVNSQQISLSLQAQGPRDLLDEIEAHLKSVQQDVITSPFKLPIDGKLTSEQLQALSQSCGTHTDKFSDSEVIISYLKSQPESLARTQRTILALAYKTHVAKPPTLYYHQSEEALKTGEEALYSVLPFAPVPSQSVTIADAPGYRIQRANPVHAMEEIVPLGVEDSLGPLKDLDSGKFDVQEWLHNFKAEAKSKLVIEASPGHVVLEPVSSKAFTSFSPLPGQLGLNPVLDFIKSANDYRPRFHPFVPKSIFDFRTTSSTSSQRLVYSEADPATTETGKHVPSPRSVFRCWLSIRHPADEPPVTPSANKALVLPINDTPAEFVVKCETGIAADLNVLMPDRDADLRFKASSIETLPAERIPKDLEEYARRARDVYESQLQEGGFEGAVPHGAAPPLFVYQAGKRFVLTSVKNVRRNKKQFTGEVGPPFEVVTETVVDSENSLAHGQTTCQISCDPDATEVQWDRFLRNCEWLTRAGVAKRSKPLFEEDFSGGL